jgi:uncharacterized protein YjbJ (UPF0337 family)
LNTRLVDWNQQGAKNMVDRSVVEGTIENVGGKVEEAAGYLTGDPGARVEGRVRQVAGKAQAAYGKAADTVSSTSDRLQEAAKHQPLRALLLAGMVGFVLGRLTAA